MTKRRAPQELQQRRKKANKSNAKEKSSRSSLFSKGWNVFVALAVIAGAFGTYYYFRPTVDIETPSSTPSDAFELFSRPFVVKNNSLFFPVHDLHASCGIVRIWRGTPSSPQLEEGGFIADDAAPLTLFDPGEEHSVPCSSATESNAPVVRAEVVVALDYYRPWYYMGHTETHQGYSAVIGRDGRAYWTPYAIRR